MSPQEKHGSRHMCEEDSVTEESTSSYHSSRSSRSSPVPKRRLHFDLTENRVHPIPHINDLSDLEVKQTWYERSDYEKIKIALIPIVRKMMKGEYIEETNGQTIRGLEYRTRQGAIRRQHNKAEAIATVLDEQDRQLGCEGQVNDQLLRQAYIHVNAHCRKEAHELALGDVAPAREHCADVSQSLTDSAVRVDFTPAPPTRKSSFSKLFKQMRIRRRPALCETAAEVPNAVIDRPIAGMAA